MPKGYIPKDVIPIGVPIKGNEIYILNDNLSLSPLGVIGEICIGGRGVAIGYLNKEKLTKEKYIENPFVQRRFPRAGAVQGDFRTAWHDGRDAHSAPPCDVQQPGAPRRVQPAHRHRRCDEPLAGYALRGALHRQGHRHLAKG